LRAKRSNPEPPPHLYEPWIASSLTLLAMTANSLAMAREARYSTGCARFRWRESSAVAKG
jgi:hypothetical protein